MSEKMRKEVMVGRLMTLVDLSKTIDNLVAIGMMILLRSPLRTIADAAITMITHLYLSYLN